MRKVSLAISAAALAFGGIAYAQMPMDHPKIDSNGDGVITRAEAQAGAAAMFARLDVNKDGKLDKSDREARRAEMREKVFAMLDTNKDGSISKQEFMADRDFGHGRMGDGHRGPGGPGMGDGDGPGMDGHHGKQWGHHGGMMKMAKMADTNHDGAISQAEFMAAADKHFDMVDTNKDGQITKEERDAARAKMKAAWQARQADKADASQ
jgi:Ca2+-binding EF-hand superfamily protein